MCSIYVYNFNHVVTHVDFNHGVTRNYNNVYLPKFKLFDFIFFLMKIKIKLNQIKNSKINFYGFDGI